MSDLPEMKSVKRNKGTGGVTASQKVAVKVEAVPPSLPPPPPEQVLPVSEPLVRVRNRLKMNPFVIPLFGEGGKSEGALLMGKKGTSESISAPFLKKLIQTSPHLLAALDKKQVDLLE